MTTDRDTLQSQYDAKIDACLVEARELREARNADCSFTGKLPREILTMIFGILAEDTNEIKSYHTLPSWIGCAVVTHVCRAWRNTALSEPTLWTDLACQGSSSYRPWWTTLNEPVGLFHSTPSSSRWLQELFVRSKTAPLCLYLSGAPSESCRYIFEHMLHCPERFKSLTLYNNQEYLLGLTKPMPYLEQLFLGTRVVIPDNFACGSAPRLHSLELSNVVMPLHASWFSNVRKLSLFGEWSPTDEGHVLTVKELLVFLSRLPRLVDLSITLPEKMDATVCPSPGNATRLSLKSLQVDVGPSIAAFKEILRFMVVDKLRLFVVAMLSDFEDRGVMVAAVKFFEASTRAPSYAVEWEANSITMNSRDDFEEATFHLLAPLESTSFSWGSYLSDITITMVKLRPHWLEFESFFPIQECQTIEEVQIDAVDALEELLHLKPSGATPVPYPSLRRLHLRQVSFTPKTKNIPRFRRWISERMKVSALEKLIIERCGLTTKEVALLAKTIPVDSIP